MGRAEVNDHRAKLAEAAGLEAEADGVRCLAREHLSPKEKAHSFVHCL